MGTIAQTTQDTSPFPEPEPNLDPVKLFRRSTEITSLLIRAIARFHHPTAKDDVFELWSCTPNFNVTSVKTSPHSTQRGFWIVCRIGRNFSVEVRNHG